MKMKMQLESFFKNNVFACAGSLLLHVLFSWCRAWALGCEASVVAACGFNSCAPRLQNTGYIVVMHGLSCPVALGIIPDQGLNPCLLHWQVDSLLLSHQGGLEIFKFFFPF